MAELMSVRLTNKMTNNKIMVFVGISVDNDDYSDRVVSDKHSSIRRLRPRQCKTKKLRKKNHKKKDPSLAIYNDGWPHTTICDSVSRGKVV